MALIRFSSTAALVRWLRLVGAPLRRRSQTFWTEVRGGRLLAGSTSEDGAARVEVMLQVGDSAPDDVRRWHRLGDHPTSQPARKSFDTRKGDKTAPDDTSPSAKTPFGEVVTPPPELLRHPLAQKVDRQLPGLLSEIKHHAGRYTLHWAAEGVWARLQLNVAPEVKQTKKASRPSRSAKPSKPSKPSKTAKPVDPDEALALEVVRVLEALPTKPAKPTKPASRKPSKVQPAPGLGELDGKLQAPPSVAVAEWRRATDVGKPQITLAGKPPRLALLERVKGEDVLFWPSTNDTGRVDLYGLRVGVVPGASMDRPSTVKLPLKASRDVDALLKDAARHLDPFDAVQGGYLDSAFRLPPGEVWKTLALSREEARFLTEATSLLDVRQNLQFIAWMDAAGFQGIFGDDLTSKSMLWSTDGHRLHMLLLDEPAPEHKVHLFSRLTLDDAQGEVRYAKGSKSLLALTRHTAVALDEGWRMPDVRQALPGTWECFSNSAHPCFKLTLTHAMVSDLKQALRAHRKKEGVSNGSDVNLILYKGSARLASARAGGGDTPKEAAINTELPGWPAPEGLMVGFNARYVAAALDSIGACEATIFDTFSPTLWRAGERAAVLMPLRV